MMYIGWKGAVVPGSGSTSRGHWGMLLNQAETRFLLESWEVSCALERMAGFWAW